MKMTDHSAWRRVLAEQFAEGYRGLPGVRAVLLAGSVARGFADRYSDIELTVFWNGPPPERLRRHAAEAGGGIMVQAHSFDPDNDEWADDITLSGVEIQASHRTVDGTERWLADVVTGFDPDLAKQDLIALIRSGVPVHDADLVRSWQERTEVYPRKLAIAMVRAHLDFRSAWQRRKLLDRRELLPLYTDLVDSARNIVLVLFGLNYRYFPHLGFKWLPHDIAALTSTPANLTTRLNTTFTASPQDAVRAIDSLIEETLTLAGASLPEAGANEELTLFRQTRPVWDGSPLDQPTQVI